MTREEIHTLVHELAKDESLNFDDFILRFEAVIAATSVEDFKKGLFECGIIPESVTHDSTEEKSYSKFSDAVLARSLSLMGIPATVIKQRADAADVEGVVEGYSMVADAKAFRLSRTAKNQKDFKVEALSQWRGDHTYACLVCPAYQYPNTSSQIYRQAIEKNVTLLSFAHLYTILDTDGCESLDFTPLWKVGLGLTPSKDADEYWKALNMVLIQILGIDQSILDANIAAELGVVRGIAKQEIGHLETKISAYQEMTKEEAIKQLIEAEKLEGKIVQIKKTVGLE